MKEIKLDLLRWYSRPVIKLYGVEALIDTGAEIPVFSLSEHELKRLFNAELLLKRGAVRGFGGEFTGAVYRLYDFRIDELYYPKMKVLVPDDLSNGFFRMILSASMFHNLSCNIDFKNHQLSIVVPENESLRRDIRVLDSQGNEHIMTNTNPL